MSMTRKKRACSALDFEKEQVEMVEYTKKLGVPKEMVHKKGEWNKFFGDVANRITIEHLNKYLPTDHVAIGPGAYIEGVAREFDMIIVNKRSEPLKFTNAFPRGSVVAAVEVKRTGVFYKKEEAEERMRQHYQKLVAKLEEIPLFYITFHESEKLMEATKRVYGDSAFFLSTGTDYGIILLKEWRRFVEKIISMIKNRMEKKT